MTKKALGPFAEQFIRQLDDIEKSGQAVGINMTVICKEARVSRAGPVRWRRKVPTTIKLIDRMQRVVDKYKAKAEAAKV